MSLSRACPRPIGIPADHFSGNTIRTDRQPRRVKLPGSIDQGNVSRASTRMHVGSRPRGERVEVLPAAVLPGPLPHRGRSWPAW